MALNKTMTFDLELKPGGIPPIIHASQGDIGRMFKANIYWDGSAATSYISGATVNLRGRKPDKTVFDYTATLAGSMVTFETTEQMTIISGPVECELVFSNDGDIIASANFVLMVEDSPYDPDAPSESVVPGIEDLIEQTIGGDVSDEVDAWLDAHPEATTTVQDGAITKAKISTAFLPEIENAYVTPEMFGAKGDGTTDDTEAIQAAIDSGLPVYGYYNKRYCAVGLVLKSYAKIHYLKLKPPAGVQNAVGITIRSHVVIDNCVFSEYETAIRSADDTSTVHARVYRTLIQYCNNGIVLDQSTYSCNNIFIENNYFAKCGKSPDDFTTDPQTDGGGYGIKAVGNFDGVQIIGNVFEYCTNSGVSLINTNNNYRVGAVVIANYFEGNKYSSIYVDVPTITNFIKIAGNYYSWILTNVKNTRFLYWRRGCTCFDVENASKTTISNCGIESTDYLNRETGMATIPAGSSQYMSMAPIINRQGPSKTYKLVYNATLNSNIQLRASDASTVLATLSNGRGVAYMRGDNSFFWNRVLASGEQIIIESYEPA